jgi:hypothetical protein
MRLWRTTKHENGSMWYRALNLLFSVKDEVIFIAEDFTGVGPKPLESMTCQNWVQEPSPPLEYNCTTPVLPRGHWLEH